MRSTPEKPFFILGDGTDPYRNLAVEEYLLNRVEPGECIFYLWQNAHTVVVGRNQNCWSECRVEALETDGGNLARRLSGGGAVYHDLGNLNFTFVAQDEIYDVARQLGVIAAAVERFGIRVEKSGRNDIVAEGRKFSGNAFYRKGKRCYHHGTVLVDVKMDALSKYLAASREKLASKGVSSVRSRVVNLSELNRDVTTGAMRASLIEAFGAAYGSAPAELQTDDIPTGALSPLEARLRSDEWKYDRMAHFDFEAARRFAWGDICLQLRVEGGFVSEAKAYSDAMDAEAVASIPERLAGRRFSSAALADALAPLGAGGDAAGMASDIAALIRESF